MARISLTTLFILLYSKLSFAQNNSPKITAFIGIVHPIVTLSSDAPVYNFKDYYLVGVPVGINYWKTARIGLSFEFVPYIRSENNGSKMSNFLFHPGILVALGKGYTFAGRAAFETSGRYGFTPVLNKVIIKSKNCNYYIAVPLPVRFGNDRTTSATIAFQFGISF